MGNPNLPINGKYNSYVGARYVPVFADPIEWSDTTIYEPLTIVMYQGNSYTSKTFVPVGVVPTNTIYWAPTGNYNAQVELYRQEVLNLMNKTLYYDVKAYGAIGDGITDDTQAIQKALNERNLIIFSDGTYLTNTLTIKHDTTIIGSGNLKPIFIDGVPNSIFVSNGNNVVIEGITFVGEKTGVYRPVKRQSLIFINNAEFCSLNNLSYNYVTDCETDIEEKFQLRQGAFITVRDVNVVELNNIFIDGCKNEELIWIQSNNKDRDLIDVKINGFYSKNVEGLSLLDVISNSVSITNAYSDISDNAPSISWCNFLCKYVSVSNSKLLGRWNIAIDNNEDLNMCETTIINNCEIKNSDICCDLQSKTIHFYDNDVSGILSVKNSVNTVNPNYQYQYLSYVDTDNYLFENNKFKYVEGNRKGAINYIGNRHGIVEIRNNYFNMNNQNKGSVAELQNVDSAIICGNRCENLCSQGNNSTSKYTFGYQSKYDNLLKGECIVKDNTFDIIPNYELYLLSNVHKLHLDNNLLIGNKGAYIVEGQQ